MRLNQRNIERIMDVLQFAVDHYGQVFMENDVYRAYPKTTSNIIDLLIDLDVLTSTKDGIWIDENNVEEYRSLLSDLEDEINELKISENEKGEIKARFDSHLNLNINLINIDAGL